MLPLGVQLETLCASAQHELVLVAPFIKVSALGRLLAQIERGVQIRCVTRWRPDEIIAGVSDLETWLLIQGQDNASLWLRPDLHAKYYRADERCLVGSANVTNKALGWSQQPNLELLVPMKSDFGELAVFEQQLFAGSVQVDNSIYEQMCALGELFAGQRPVPVFDVQDTEDTSADELEQVPIVPVDAWLPMLRYPEHLYIAYCGDWDKLAEASRVAAQADLTALQVTPELSKEAFEIYVGALLLQMPIIQQVDKYVAKPRRFGAVRDLLASLPCANTPDFDASRAWQTLMRWMGHFLPQRYKVETPGYSEVFSRKVICD